MGPEFTPPPPTPPQASPPPPYPPPYIPEPPHARRLTRSSRERMWAGVAGGMAEYFELDPALVRLLWIAATVVSGGLAVPVYILAWILLPRDDRPPYAGSYVWRDWSQDFHNETQRLAEDARRMADDVRGTGRAWRAPTAGEGARDPATDKGAPVGFGATPPPQPDWWSSERYVQPEPEARRARGHHPRSTGVVLVALGVFLLAANAGLFSWIEWRTMWPLIFIGLGVILLGKQSNWGR